MTSYPKRLIEVDLPIKRISTHARREKSIRHGHISTLHIWWARRPLAACRAVICAALWLDPADPLCPEAFRREARQQMINWARDHWEKSSEESAKQLIAISKKPSILDDNETLRRILLDFIADFANWDHATDADYLATSRALTQSSHEALGGAPGTRPLVVDPFAGGGAIPLEALRVGADAFASDLNPVAVLLNKVVLEYIPKYGHQLADELRKWGAWIKQEAEKELAEFYPKDADGATPIAYLWARTIRCEGPGCGAEVPLMRSLWLAKKAKNSVALRVVPKPEQKRVDFEIITNAKACDVKGGMVQRGSATCPCCGYTTPVARVREQLKLHHGGTNNSKLIVVITSKLKQPGRIYRLPQERDFDAVKDAASKLFQQQIAHRGLLSLIPDEPTPEGIGKGAGRAFSQRNYGMTTFADVFTHRQLLALSTFAKIIRENQKFQSKDFEIIKILCGFALSRVSDLSMSLCRWVTTKEFISAANGGQNKMPVILDYAEANPIGGGGGDWLGQIDWVARVVEHIQDSKLLTDGTVRRSPAQLPNLPEDSVDAFITDPPYYDAFPYSDLSDFFFIWLKRSLGAILINYHDHLAPKNEEIVVYDVAHGGNIVKNHEFFKREMTKSFLEWRNITKNDGIGVIVFANKTTSGWESLIQSIIDAGWIATASWPIDTERPNRQRAIDSASLASSVHVVCRPRKQNSPIGDWRDILSELPQRIHEWMPRLATEGVVGADAIFACLGPALEIFSRYSQVEKVNGETVTLKEYLEHVWAAVAKEAMEMIFKGADASGLEEDARLTAMWLWTLSTGSIPVDPQETDGDLDEDDDESDGKKTKSVGFVLEYDAARKIAQGLGARMETMPHLVAIKGDQARLLAVTERTRYLFGKEESAPVSRGPGSRKPKQGILPFEEVEQTMARSETEWGISGAPKAGATVLDRIHQGMILFASGRSEALKRFLVEEGAGRDTRFWRLAQALSALYPAVSEEKRWVDGLLARKRGLGF